MKVSGGSKIRNLMGFAVKHMKDPKVKQITWNGSGQGINKCLTCAEILKRKVKGLHQINKVRFKRIEEHWEPQKEGLERLKVNRDIPAITILLSKTPLDQSIPGYQPPGSFDAFWKQLSAQSSENPTKKQTKSDNESGRHRKRKQGAKGLGKDNPHIEAGRKHPKTEDVKESVTAKSGSPE